ncbi:aminotransferase class IV [Dysgonomonas sp. Marseille-P4677]|uniref:aminotransferase class IV n=1 Tax=Dysgonomonas sp. Marseille-P4677 TaxID=2364790 RepID=UPI001914B175|nr:aminotransferase class IV [Dysgonomonas sp. Marseille-P4677]MBK5720054.1 aminotransferase class IV [Dysgonomonas sp. Marseille-P4677]
MKEPYFIETIKVIDGKFLNLPYHMDRMNHTMISFFNTSMFVELWIGDIPPELRIGVVKCRIVYSYCSVRVEYERYNLREIKRLKLVTDNTLDYSFKYKDRERINSLLDQRQDCDDILIVKNGFITDTSFSNVVFQNEYGLYTPSSYLLAGTKRRKLLETGAIKETEIRKDDISNYFKLYLINAMIDIEDHISIDISSIS